MIKLMILAGLGNPGNRYEGTGHNIGFEVLDEFGKVNNFPSFKMDKKFSGLLSKRGDIFLLKPQTFMNKSGNSVRALADYYKISPEEILVIHDDADFDLGKVKIDKNRSSAGHKGVQSIIDHLSTKDFWRLRFGIGRKDKKAGDIALKKFSKKEKVLVESLIEKSVRKVEEGLKSGFEKESFKEKN